MNSTDPILNLPASATAPVLFDRGVLSNFHLAEIVLPCPYRADPDEPLQSQPTRYFATTEHYFQARKVAAFYRAQGKFDRYRAVAEASTAGLAKKLAGPSHCPLPPELRAQWDHGGSFAAMLAACRAKFRQHPELRTLLLSTDSRLLIEHRPDPTWGDNLDGSGRNLLGLVLMLVREELR